MTSEKNPYLVEGILRACELLHAFRDDSETLGIADLVHRTGLKKTTVFRAARSLAEGRILDQVANGRYRCLLRPPARGRYRLGYAAQASDSIFAHDVTESIRRAAMHARVDLIEVDNHYSPKVALRSAERLIHEGADLVIEFQTYESVAPIISAKLAEARIPLIAIEIPHPGASYFGADNYRAGTIGGQAAGRWVQQHWSGCIDEVLLLSLTAAGSLPNSRLTGFSVGLREIIGSLEDRQIIQLDSKGEFGATLELVRKHLRTSRSQRILVASLNDAGALGALRAFDEAGRLDHCAVMSHNACIIARAELRKPGTRLIGSVAYFPEKYGDTIIRMALDILAKKPRPSAIFVRHTLITSSNVDRYYPNDSTLLKENCEAVLMGYSR